MHQYVASLVARVVDCLWQSFRNMLLVFMCTSVIVHGFAGYACLCACVRARVRTTAAPLTSCSHYNGTDVLNGCRQLAPRETTAGSHGDTTVVKAMGTCTLTLSLTCAHTHTHTHTYVHSHICAHTHAHTHARTHACTHTRTHTALVVLTVQNYDSLLP